MCKPLSIIMIMALIFQTGCYNTYSVSMDEFKKIQEADGASFKTVTTEDGVEITVTENSRVGVTDINGKYYSVSPFNFTLNNMQLVAPDDDILMPTKAIEQTNIKLVNPTDTAMLIGGVALVVIGAAIGVIVSTPDCEGQFCQQ
ncbi:MAG: hypothetical protein CL916_06340 [Deltaproteobacteria bacterium]|nr:hypothetical protein [Deltaproteobacteria bacterium]